MKNKKVYILGLLILMSSGLYAQTATDIYRISVNNRSLGTARSAAMAGAFTSLGADPSSMSINPAGLGMYRSSEISFSPTIITTTINTNTSLIGGTEEITYSEKATNFTVSNFSGIFNIYKSNKRAVKSITLGIGYSKKNYVNYASISESPLTDISLLDHFSNQLDGINPKYIQGSSTNNTSIYLNNPTYLWGAIMAFNSDYFDVTGDDFDYRIYKDILDVGDKVSPYQDIIQKTITDNFDFSMGMNISDFVYLGLTLSSQSYEHSKTSVYSEILDKKDVENKDSFEYVEYNNVTGDAFSAKLGATIEPLNGFKIGISYHFPTITYIEDEFYADMNSVYFDKLDNKIENTISEETPYDPIEYKINSAPALLIGASYRLPFGIISFDYEREWNNKMKIKSSSGGQINIDQQATYDDMNIEIGNTYRATNKFMVGLEANLGKGLFLRGGYAYYGSPYNISNLDNDSIFNDSKYGVTKNISAGIGYRGKSFYFDAAYINSKYLDVSSYYNDSNSVTLQTNIDSIFTFTLGVRF